MRLVNSCHINIAHNNVARVQLQAHNDTFAKSVWSVTRLPNTATIPPGQKETRIKQEWNKNAADGQPGPNFYTKSNEREIDLKDLLVSQFV